MPRSIWTGSISFGLVNVPVRLFGAVKEHNLHFHLIHERDESPIGYEKVCKKEDRPVPDDEIVKGYEYAKGRYVHMTDEDFAAARVEGYKAIEVHDFVAYEEIDPIYFRHTYLVGPQRGAERVYALLVKAMEQSGLAGITKFIMRDRQNLGCLRVREGVLTLEQMYFADEIRPLDEIQPEQVKVDRRELEMALQLIDRFSGDFDPTKYADTYRDALRDVIDKKRKGKQVHVAAEVEEDAPADLMDALRQSIQRRSGARRKDTTSANGDLAGKSKQDLMKLAQKAGVPGRSQMDKSELLHALRSRK